MPNGMKGNPMEQKKPLPKKAFYIIISVLVIFAIIMIVKMGTLINKNNKLAEELKAKEAESIEMEEKNAALEALMKEENESLLMEQYAREQDYVYPDEHVYIYGN